MKTQTYRIMSKNMYRLHWLLYNVFPVALGLCTGYGVRQVFESANSPFVKAMVCAAVIGFAWNRIASVLVARKRDAEWHATCDAVKGRATRRRELPSWEDCWGGYVAEMADEKSLGSELLPRSFAPTHVGAVPSAEERVWARQWASENQVGQVVRRGNLP